MLQVSQQQTFTRWDALPDILREALCSPQNATILQRICEGEHLPEEKIRAVSRITGFVLMGFLHPEEASREIRDTIAVDPKLATVVADAINNRIFNQLRGELEKIYAPPTAEAPIAPPKLIEEIKKPAEVPKPLTLVMSEAKPPPQVALPSTAPAAKAAPAISPAAPPPKPLGAVPIPPLRAEAPKPATPQPAAPAPLPTMLHAESEFKPIGRAGDAHIGVAALSFRDAKPAAAPTPPTAKLELGATPTAVGAQPTVARTEVTAPKIVHYSQFKTPLDQPPAAPAAGTTPPSGPIPLSALTRRPASAGPSAAPPVPATSPAKPAERPPIQPPQPPPPPQQTSRTATSTEQPLKKPGGAATTITPQPLPPKQAAAPAAPTIPMPPAPPLQARQATQPPAQPPFGQPPTTPVPTITPPPKPTMPPTPPTLPDSQHTAPAPPVPQPPAQRPSAPAVPIPPKPPAIPTVTKSPNDKVTAAAPPPPPPQSRP